MNGGVPPPDWSFRLAFPRVCFESRPRHGVSRRASGRTAAAGAPRDTGYEPNPEPRALGGGIRLTEVRSIRQVEEFRPELQPDRLWWTGRRCEMRGIRAVSE